MQRTLLPTLRLSLEMTDVLARIEQQGLKINLQTLDEIEKEYQEEMDILEVRLNELAREAMGILRSTCPVLMIAVCCSIRAA